MQRDAAHRRRRRRSAHADRAAPRAGSWPRGRRRRRRAPLVARAAEHAKREGGRWSTPPRRGRCSGSLPADEPGAALLPEPGARLRRRVDRRRRGGRHALTVPATDARLRQGCAPRHASYPRRRWPGQAHQRGGRGNAEGMGTRCTKRPVDDSRQVAGDVTLGIVGGLHVAARGAGAAFRRGVDQDPATQRAGMQRPWSGSERSGGPGRRRSSSTRQVARSVVESGSRFPGEISGSCTGQRPCTPTCSV